MEQEDFLLSKEKVMQFAIDEFIIEFSIENNTWIAIHTDPEIDEIFILEDEEEGICFEGMEIFGVYVTEQDFNDLKEIAKEELF
jgi:hypothetical protein